MKNVFNGFSIRKLLLTIMCAIVVSSFIGLTELFVQQIQWSYIVATSQSNGIEKEIAENADYYNEFEEAVTRMKEENGEDYPAENIMLFRLTTYLPSVVRIYALAVLVGVISGTMIYILFIQKVKGFRSIVESVICLLAIAVISLIVSEILKLGGDALLSKYNTNIEYAGVFGIDGRELLLVYVAIAVIVYMANLIHQIIVTRKLNKELN